MMLPRKLTYRADGKRVETNIDELRSCTKPMVILGEAGSGKTTLLQKLSVSEGFKLFSAARIARSADPRTLVADAEIILIDAVDEAAEVRQGEVIDRVVEALEAAGRPRFVIACRVADWRSATSAQRIAEVYGEKPLELHINPLTATQAREFLASYLAPDQVREIENRFERGELAGWLGNPQTLRMLAEVAQRSGLPESSYDLFDKYVDLAWPEHSETKTDSALHLSGQEAVTDAIGAAFAALILTGKTFISRRPVQMQTDEELAISEIARLPSAAGIDRFLGSRLIISHDANTFTYSHRRIGEFLGARWLAKQANSQRKRRRLLSLFKEGGLVPNSLRGLHAWLARDSQLARFVIESDPAGVIEYGDTENITSGQAKILLSSLEELAFTNPWFLNWASYRLNGIAQAPLKEDLRRIITSRISPQSLRYIVLKALKRSPLSSDMASELSALMLDANQPYAVRISSADALAEVAGGYDWQAAAKQLREMGDEDSARLNVELLGQAGFEHFNDVQIVEAIFAHLGTLQCDFPKRERGHVRGMYFQLWEGLPENRTNSLLEIFTEYASLLVDKNSPYEFNELADLAYELILKRVNAGDFTAEALWRWLSPYYGDMGYKRDARNNIDDIISSRRKLKQAVQRHVLLEMKSDEDIWRRHYRLTQCSQSFSIDHEDAVSLLDALGDATADEHRWREIVTLVAHNNEEGAAVRSAARRFAVLQPGQEQWLDSLSAPPEPSWKVKRDQKLLQQRVERERRWGEHKENFERVIDDIRQGQFGALLPLAQAYLRLFNDIGRDLPPQERIAEWVGNDIQSAAFQGFEAFLQMPPAKPTARDIAESSANGREWKAAYIVVAALAERLRLGKDYRDLSDDRLISGYLQIQNSAVDHHAELPGLREALELELRARGDAWEKYWRLAIEPKLANGTKHIGPLHDLMRQKRDADLATQLAREWLAVQPKLEFEPESEMVDRLIEAGAVGDLRAISSMRSVGSDLHKRRLWSAVSLLTDFDASASTLAGISSRDPEFIWVVRDHLGNRLGRARHVPISPELAGWIISEFRAAYPVASTPSDGWTGSNNAWDASEYIGSLIRSLGNDVSDAAIKVLKEVRDQTADTYSDLIKSVFAEQRQKRANADYKAPTISELSSVIASDLPKSARDLQAIMLDELDVVQRKVLSDDVESWRGFFDDGGSPFSEERCRDHLLGLLRQGCEGISLEPEVHVAADKEVDIGCHVGQIRVPIEVKGQWHRDLWHAADTQLDRLYVPDWRADRSGIYLILWFGDKVSDNKKLKSPPSGTSKPTTADELKDALSKASVSVHGGRVAVFVLDVERP